MVRLDDDGIVVHIDDKPKNTDLMFGWGFMAWRPAFTQHLHSCVHEYGIVDFAQVLNFGIEHGLRYRGVVVEGGRYSDLGTFEEIMELERRHRSM